jgi:SAM-dependent methyltransferase
VNERPASGAPGWKRLWWHSYAIGLRWLIRDAVHGWPARRVGLARLLVPLDPWRYYELGRVADEAFSGRCLDVSSPKLLSSLLQAEGKGRWLCIDLFEREIEAWRRVDPRLELAVQDATALPYADGSFDNCVCISVLEHVGRGNDAAALAEIWRVLAPGGALHLTTDVAPQARDVYVAERVYGDASRPVDGHGVFFEHEYAPEEIDELVGDRPWAVEEREFAVQRRPGIERRFYAWAPWSYLAGPFLRLVCPGNTDVSPIDDAVRRAGRGVVYLRLRKPEGATA